MLLHISVFLNLCIAEDWGNNHLGTSNIALVTREICKIRSDDSFYCAFYTNIALFTREIWKIPIMCRGQINGISRIALILRTKAKNLSPILGENLFFFSDHLILESNFNKNGVKVPRFLKNALSD